MAIHAPDQRAVLGGQVQELVEQLNHVERALKDDQIDEELREKVGVRFQLLVTQQRDSALGLRTSVAEGAELGHAWATLQERRAACTPLFAECLAFVEGALARSIDLDRGLCKTADVLLQKLSNLTDGKWDRFTILAEGEFFYDMAEIIRMRFPEVSIWSLPAAAHEFGHYLAGTFEDGKSEAAAAPFRKAKQRGPREWAHFHELFADAFAIYAMGPSYACTCALLRFDPATAHDEAEDHPSPAARVRLMLDALENLDADLGVIKPYADVRAMLSEGWDAMVASATGSPPNLEPAAEEDLGETLGALWPLLEKVSTMRYQTWTRAEGLASALHTQHRNMAALSATSDDLRDVINAAWMARLSGPAEAVPAFGAWAETQAQAIVARHNGQNGANG
jgi:hypothetical protein